MKTFVFKRPEDRGFSRKPVDFVRVDIMVSNDRHFWSYHGESTVNEIEYKKDDTHQGVYKTAYVLAKMYNWELIGEVL